MPDEEMNTSFKNQFTPADVIQIIILVATMIYMFAVMRTEMNNNESNIHRNSSRIESLHSYTDKTFVRKDVNSKVIQQLDEIQHELQKISK
jgi:hypothetical protein